MVKEARPKNLRLLSEELEEARPALLKGIEQFNQGYFFEAHETWEDVWIVTPWPARQFMQGLIQIAAAFVHLMRREYPGTIRLLEAGSEKMAAFPAQYLGIEAGRLVAEARRAREELVALGRQRFLSWDQRKIPTIHLVGEKGAHLA